MLSLVSGDGRSEDLGKRWLRFELISSYSDPHGHRLEMWSSASLLVCTHIRTCFWRGSRPIRKDRVIFGVAGMLQEQ